MNHALRAHAYATPPKPPPLGTERPHPGGPQGCPGPQTARCALGLHAPAREPPPEGSQLQPSSALLSPRLHPATSQRVTYKANNHSPSPREPVGNGEGGVGGEGRGRTEKALRGGLVPVTQSESSGEEQGGAQEAGGGVGLGTGVRRPRGGEGGLPEIKSGQSERAGCLRRAAWGVAAAAAAARAGAWLRP